MTESLVLKVAGMKCGGCETLITTKLTALAGITEAVASSKEGSVRLVFDAALTHPDAIAAAIAEAGFTVVHA